VNPWRALALVPFLPVLAVLFIGMALVAAAAESVAEEGDWR
jgi:hypothetical protein